MHNSQNNIIIIQTAFLGDTALALYFAQAVYNYFEGNANITFVSNSNASSLIAPAACITENISFDKRNEHKGIDGLKRIAEQINTKEYEYLFCLHKSLRSAYLSILINAKQKVGFKNSALKYIFDIKADYLYFKHEIYRNYEQLKAIGGNTNPKPAIELRFNEQSKEKICYLIKEASGRKIVLIAPGSVWETKRWRAEHFQVLTKKLIQTDYFPILIGAKSEADLCNSISADALNLAGKTSINETLFLMTKSDLLISNDSSPIHFAQITKLKTIAIFGPTSPIFGFAPINENDTVLYNFELKCTPCRIHGSRSCPIGSHICMKSIKPEDVFSSIENKINLML